jgi:hypothetical protein
VSTKELVSDGLWEIVACRDRRGAKDPLYRLGGGERRDGDHRLWRFGYRFRRGRARGAEGGRQREVERPVGAPWAYSPKLAADVFS